MTVRDYTYAAAGAVAPSVRAHLMLHVDAARERGRTGSRLGAGRAGDRADDRRGVLGEPAPRRGDGAEDFARVPDARGNGTSRSFSSVAIPLESAALTRLAAGGRAARHPPGRCATTEASCRCGGWSAPSRSTAASSRSPSRVCSSSSTIAARRRPSSSTWRCCRATQREGHRRARIEPSGLPVAADVAAGVRLAVDVGRDRQRAGAARRVDARARTRRRVARGAGREPMPGGNQSCIRLTYDVSPPFDELAMLAPGAGRRRQPARLARGAEPGGRRRCQPDRDRRRHGHDERL